MRTTKLLPEPTMEFVKSKITEFNSENDAIERGLTLLIEEFPDNTDIAHVLVKVAAINSLYNTQIRGVYAVAEIIKNAAIGPLLNAGDPGVVFKIAQVHFADKTRWNYSFATKYCSWHKPELFPIYDSMVSFCLMSYRNKDHFAEFVQNDLFKYAKLREIVEEFRKHYRLESTGFKDIDKFFFQLGRDSLRALTENGNEG